MVKKSRVKGFGQSAKTQTSAGRRRFLKTAAVTAGAAASTAKVAASSVIRRTGMDVLPGFSSWEEVSVKSAP